MTTANCLFCRIVAGDIPSDMVRDTDNVYAFRDIAPKAPTHVLVIPKVHVANIVEAAAQIPAVVAEMAAVANDIATEECGGQFRWIFNTGPRAGQSVFHAHGHVIGGADLEWEPA